VRNYNRRGPKHIVIVLSNSSMCNMEAQSQLILDTTRLQLEIRARGFATAQEFADSVGVHRNTVGNYLSGKTALPNALARILTALDLAPADVLSLPVRRRQVPGLALVDLIEQLRSAAPDVAVVLFGSRARGTAKRYSDYDVGIFGSEKFEFAAFSRLLDLASSWNEASLATVQLVDLTPAEAGFLTNLSKDLVFLAGSHAAWCGLLRKAGMRLHE